MAKEMSSKFQPQEEVGKYQWWLICMPLHPNEDPNAEPYSIKGPATKRKQEITLGHKAGMHAG